MRRPYEGFWFSQGGGFETRPYIQPSHALLADTA
jgi:hypothetical protein